MPPKRVIRRTVRSIRKTKTMTKIGRGIASRTHKFKVYVGRSSLTFNNMSSEVKTGLNFRLTDLPNVSEFVNLFDSYKITKIDVIIKPTWTETTVPLSGSAPIIPRIVTAIDYNDSTAPTSMDELREYGTCKITDGFKAHRRTIYPKIRGNAYESAGGVGYLTMKPQYIDTDDSTVVHYGLKIFMENGTVSTSGNPWSARVECIYHFQCKAQK